MVDGSFVALLLDWRLQDCSFYYSTERWIRIVSFTSGSSSFYSKKGQVISLSANSVLNPAMDVEITWNRNRRKRLNCWWPYRRISKYYSWYGFHTFLVSALVLCSIYYIVFVCYWIAARLGIISKALVEHTSLNIWSLKFNIYSSGIL